MRKIERETRRGFGPERAGAQTAKRRKKKKKKKKFPHIGFLGA